MDLEHMSEAGRAAALRSIKRKSRPSSAKACIDLRPENEDDDGYDPYPDYMDALARSNREEPEEDPWR